MGLLDGLMGNASEVRPAEVEREFAPILSKDEKIEKAYRLIRDLILFTNKRLILVDRQGLTGRKVSYHSIPYRAITHFSIETAGHLDLDAELKIWVTGQEAPLEQPFNRSLNIYALQAVLAEYVLR
ncbi:MAG: PH domain-containing protein [Pseudomonadota bacterium]